MKYEYIIVFGFYYWNKISLHDDQDGGCRNVNVSQNVFQLDKVEIETGWRTYQHFLLENVLGCRLLVGEHICFIMENIFGQWLENISWSGELWAN